jgi:tetratricopeptide (TPR) repeat protein
LLDEAEDILLHALPFCEKASQIGWGAWTAGILGHVYFDMGEFEKAQEYYEKGISTLESTGIYPSWANMWKVFLAMPKALNSDQNIKLSEIFECYDNIVPGIFRGWAARHVGELLLIIDNQHTSEAEDWVKKAIETDKRNCTMWSLGCDYAFYAELLKRQGDPAKARENLSNSIDIFKECGADGWVEKYEKEFAEL